jgi:DNA repair exonuclease SbcCD ATPase subunit
VINQFMQARGIVGMNETADALVIQEADVSIADVENALADARKLVNTIEELDPDRVPSGVPEKLDGIEEELEQTNPDASEKLEAMHVEAKYGIDRLKEVGELLHSHHQSECDDVKTKAERKRRSLIPDHLEKEVAGGVQFVGGLNDARSELLAKFREVKTDLSELIETLEDASRKHNSPTVEAANNLYQEVSDARDRLDSIDNEIDDLENYADELKRWRTFTDKAANVKQDIKDYSRTFDEALDEEDDIEDFIAQIAERLVENPLDALMNREAFQERLNHIEESYQQRREQRRDVFDAKRENLKTILDEATEGGTVGLRSATFDVKQPDESRRHLLEDFKNEYGSQVLDNAEGKLENASNEIEYAQIVGVEADTDADPDRVAEEIEQVQATLRSLRTSLSRFDFEDIGDDTDLAEEGNALVTKANELADEARKFRSQSLPDDDEVQDLLRRVENNRGADFKELLMEYHEDGDNIEVDELLNRMEQLFKLNQIDIKITQRRGRR